MRHYKRLVLIAVTWLVIVPTAAYAQASIAGTVKDTSGAVLPGATVEAASPVLIEKVRSAVTDGTGQFRIENLRPGIYTVTFTLAGFNTVKREGIELTGSFTALVNVELKVGAVEETVTVSGETPIVDVQSAKRQQVLSSEVLTTLPTVGAYNALLVLVPGITSAQRDVATGPCGSCVFSIHGGRSSEGRIQLDGLNVGVAMAGNGTTVYLTDIGNSQEVTFTTSGGLGEAETSGPLMNIVPRTGGNTNQGSFFSSFTNGAMQADNFTQALKDAGLRAPSPLTKTWEVDGAFGGPVRKDRLWYFATARDQGTGNYVTNMYFNKNAGNPAAWTYEPDLNRQAKFERVLDNVSLRLTWQVTPRNKINLFWDEQWQCKRCTGTNPINLQPSATMAPESVGHADVWPQRAQQASWTAPVTNRALVEFGVGTFLNRWGGRQPPDNPTINLVSVTEQCTAGCAVNGNIPGLVYRSLGAGQWASNWSGAHTWRAATSYVTGAHSLKFGYQGAYLVDDAKALVNSQALRYRVNNGVPNQLTMEANPFQNYRRVRYNAFYAQEQWTFARLTVQGGVRFDNAWSYFPAEQVGPARFVPVPLVFPDTPGVSYKDVTPRMGATYNLFGNGKTAVKVNLGKYLEAANGSGIYYAANPTSRISTVVTRSWADANQNFLPDCDLLNPAAQDLRASGADLCGAMSDPNFGKNVFSNTLDPAILSGWGVRPSDWSFGVSLQQQLLPRVSVEVGYFRRWFGNFIVTDNRAVGASDFSQFSVMAPIDTSLPGGGGNVISGLYDVSPTLFGQTNNFLTSASNYGNQYQHFDGVDITVNARVRGGVTFQGGISVGQTVTDNCEIRSQLPEIALTNPYCHTAAGFLTQVKGLGSYTIPKVDVLFSATFQSDPGQILQANYGVSTTVVAQTLGRNLAGNAPNVTVNLIAPGALYGDRLNQLNLRVAKILKYGRTRTQIGVDLYNALNSTAVLTYNQAFIPGGAWLTPTQVLTARFAKISAQIDF